MITLDVRLILFDVQDIGMFQFALGIPGLVYHTCKMRLLSTIMALFHHLHWCTCRSIACLYEVFASSGAIVFRYQ